jgi:hypothetical protein
MKKSNYKSTLTTLGCVLGAALVFNAASTTFAGDSPRRGDDCRSGRSLAAWDNIYFRWYLGALTIPNDVNGNAVVDNVVLMPLPNVPGDGTPGHLDLTFKRGQGFVLPLLDLLGTSYTDGTPPDPLVNVSFFKTLQLTLKIDGVTVVNNRNLMDVYSQFYFKPPVTFDSPPTAAVIWCEAIGIVHGPLSVGTHQIKLDAKSTQALPPNFGGGILEYHNTWTVTVLPEGGSNGWR